jgi:DNA invertase Pin-like site-specific DNA recombinase
MANALVVRKSHLPSRRDTLRAAQYVRMSTDKQRYSIQNQAAVIATYAHAHGLQIVKTYRDEGESGLHIKNRAGLRQLISDISSGDADFSHVLVYDVSRWGRFQDTDESAHYEFICRQAGVQVAYCAEQFDNDGSMLSSIVKNLKRVMAAEYSRDLSKRVHAGQSRTVRNGFRHGAPVTYALRRELVDEHLRPRAILKMGEHKALITDKVRLQLGTSEEAAVVRWIFEQSLACKMDTEIARELNRRNVAAGTERPWNASLISDLLRNEAYIGNIVYNRHSKKLGGPKIANPVDLWVRGEGCVTPIVDPETFRLVGKRLQDRYVAVSEGEMLSRLRRLLHRKGRLSPAIIEAASGLPGVDTYIRHFGSIRNTYRLIGYTSERDCAFIDAAQTWAHATSDLVAKVKAKLEKSGCSIAIGRSNDEMCFDRNVRVLFRVARSFIKEGHLTYWMVPRINRPPARWIVAIRLTEDNLAGLDYLLIPTDSVAGKYRSNCARITEMAFVRLGIRKYASLDRLVMSLRPGTKTGRDPQAKQRPPITPRARSRSTITVDRTPR